MAEQDFDSRGVTMRVEHSWPGTSLVWGLTVMGIVGWGGAPHVLAARPDQQDGNVTHGIGEKVADFTLSDYLGTEHKLSDFADSDVVVLAFIGTECPLAKLYAPRLVELADQLADRGVTILGIASNRQDSVTELVAFVRRHNINFPMLKDLGNKVADAVDAYRTPEVFVLDSDRVIRYRGRIDDQYGFTGPNDTQAYQRPEAERRDLSIAIDEVLAGNAVSKCPRLSHRPHQRA
jgi:peroxiredoxin